MRLVGFRDPQAGAVVTAFLLVLVVCAATTPGVCQSAAQGPNLPFQPLGANDLISVTVYGSSELTRTVRISSEGFIRLPLLEQPIRAAGKMPADLEVDIATALRKGELLVDPIVSVTVSEYVSRQVTLVGALKSPGTIQAIGKLKLLDAIARAGGLADDAGAEILVRTRESDDTSKEKRILVKSLIDRPDDQANLELHGGEEIRVPHAPRILIMGNVRKPGALLLVDSVDSTVLKALAVSEGLAPFASKTAFILRPKSNSTERDVIDVPITRILERKSPDIQLKPDDIFYVPDNKTQRISAGIVDRLVSFGSATTSGMLIWRK